MKKPKNSAVILFAACVLLISLVSLRSTSVVYAQTTAALPRPEHVVIVIDENRSFNQIIGSSSAPYINSLASRSAVFT